jgi:hypothetical protein
VFIGALSFVFKTVGKVDAVKVRGFGFIGVVDIRVGSVGFRFT